MIYKYYYNEESVSNEVGVTCFNFRCKKKDDRFALLSPTAVRTYVNTSV